MVEKEQTPAVKKEAPVGYPDFWDWGPFDTLRRQLDRFFAEAPVQKRSGAYEPFERFVSWPTGPPVDFVEHDHEYELTAELPGLDQKDVEIKVVNGALVILGEKKVEREEKDQGYFYSERRYGSFKRSFRLPEGVDTNKITARFDKGVLKVCLPKSPAALKEEKKIEISGK